MITDVSFGAFLRWLLFVLTFWSIHLFAFTSRRFYKKYPFEILLMAAITVKYADKKLCDISVKLAKVIDAANQISKENFGNRDTIMPDKPVR